MPLVFFSGSLGSTSHRPRFIDMCEARLLSCHGQYFSDAKRWLVEAYTHPRAKERYIMLDSGAFSAWSRGKHISLKEVMKNYCLLVDRFAHYFRAIYIVNLDEIPGSKGVTPTREQVEQALINSDKNLLILQKEFGESVLPVYHQGESLKRLHVVAQQAPFIGISPRNDLNERDRVPWARLVHAEIVGKATHGLAATGVEMMGTVPYHSVDSASWVQQAGVGGIFIKTDRGSFKAVKISSKSPMRGKPGHYDNSPLHIQRIIKDQADALDLSIDELRTKTGAREFFNIATLSAVSSRS